ncbi:MAG: hypothetical protein WAL92_05315 [Thiogranum sp.]
MQFNTIRHVHAFISLWAGTHLTKLAARTSRQPQYSATIRGIHTATDFFRSQLPRDLGVRQGQVVIITHAVAGTGDIPQRLRYGFDNALNWRQLVAGTPYADKGQGRRNVCVCSLAQSL